MHIHVRNDDDSSSSNPDRFAEVQAGVRKHYPGMIVQFSTGGRRRDPAARGLSLIHRPDMASLSTGSTNFPTIVYENPAGLVLDLASKMKQFGIAPEIEIFDLSHIHGAKRLIDAGLLSPRPHIQFVMGVQNALPADEHLLDILLKETRRIIPGASWTAAGIGREQSWVMQWALQRGADAVRTGMEDNIRIAKDQLASGNDELVRIAAGLLRSTAAGQRRLPKRGVLSDFRRFRVLRSDFGKIRTSGWLCRRLVAQRAASGRLRCRCHERADAGSDFNV